MIRKKIHLKESDIHRIILECVDKVLCEGTVNSVKEKALRILSDMGYEVLDEYYNNPYVCSVKINNYNDCDIIEARLSKIFGVNNMVDLHVKYDSNLFGGDKRAIIYLPTENKVSY